MEQKQEAKENMRYYPEPCLNERGENISGLGIISLNDYYLTFENNGRSPRTWQKVVVYTKRVSNEHPSELCRRNRRSASL